MEFVQFFNASASEIINCDTRNQDKLGFYKNVHIMHEALFENAFSKNETISINNFLEALRKKSKHLHKVKPEFAYLTPREQECLSYLAKGDTAKEVARNLEISPRTVETHLKTIKCKTGFHSRSQLVKFFLNHFS